MGNGRLSDGWLCRNLCQSLPAPSMLPFIHDVVANFRQGCKDKVARIVIFKEEIMYDYRARPTDGESQHLYAATARFVNQYSYERLCKAVEDKDGPLMLEYGIQLSLFLLSFGTSIS